MKYYILINPFTFKPIQFSTFIDEDFTVANIPEEITSNTVIESKKALCIESEYDPTLMEKTYDPETGTFN
jgi:hypothetical protein